MVDFTLSVYSSLVHDLLGVQGVGVKGGYLLRGYIRAFNWQVVYLVRIHYAIVLNAHLLTANACSAYLGSHVYGAVHTLVLRELGAVAFVTELAEASCPSWIRCLIHLLLSIDIIIGTLTVLEKVVLCVAGYLVFLSHLSVVLTTDIVVAIVFVGVQGRAPSVRPLTLYEVLNLVSLIVCNVNGLMRRHSLIHNVLMLHLLLHRNDVLVDEAIWCHHSVATQAAHASAHIAVPPVVDVDGGGGHALGRVHPTGLGPIIVGSRHDADCI